MSNPEYQTPSVPEVPNKNFFEKLIDPHSSIKEVGAQRKARFSAILSITAILWSLLGAVSIIRIRGLDLTILSVIFASAVLFIFAYIASRSPYFIWSGIILVGTISFITAGTLARGVDNIASTLFSNYPLAFVIGSALLPTSGLVTLVVVDIIGVSLIITSSASGDFSRDILSLLFLGVGLILASAFRENTERKRLEEVTETNKELNDLSEKLEENIKILNERTVGLEEHTSYLQGAAKVSRVATSYTNTEELSEQVVILIRELFDLYYVGLFLVDEEDKQAVLQAGSGQEGETMLSNNYHLEFGDGIICLAIQEGEPRIALDVGEDSVQFTNPALPHTRSEVALPFRSRGRVLGALTVQSRQESAFSSEIITTLQTMADQIAIAFDNLELLAKSEEALEAERQAYGELSHNAWRDLIQTNNTPVFGITADGKAQTFSNQDDTDELKVISQEVTIQNDGFVALLPIKIHGKTLGGIQIAKTPKQGIWSEEEIELAEVLAEQMSVALESARLFDQTQRRAARELVIGETSARIRETLDIESVLETAAIELHKILGEVETEVWIDAE